MPRHPGLLVDGANVLVRLAKMWTLLEALAFAVAAAGLPTFVSRPLKFQQEFPSRESFRRAGGRRLHASDGKPARTRYDFEEGGFRFAYEVSATSDAGQLVNADHDREVVAIACEARRMWIRWAALGRQLTTGDVVSGGAEWGCEAEGGFVREVSSVETTADGLVSVVETLPISTLGVFRDLYVDLTWSRVDRGRGRRAQGDWDRADDDDNETSQAVEDDLFDIVEDDEFDVDEDGWDIDFAIPAMAFNWNESRGEADEVIDIGGLRCSNCWAQLEPTARLIIETNGIWPTLVSFRMDLDFEVQLEIEQAPTMQRLIELWVPILTFGGANLINVLANSMGLPIFHVLNDAYLSLIIQPYTALHVLLASIENIVMDGTAYVNVSGTSDSTYLEVRWDSTSGFNINASADLERSFYYSGTQLGARITTGLRPCVGVRVMIDNPRQYLTSLEGCPELTAFFDHSWDVTDLLSPVDFASEAPEPDAELCFDFTSLDTDINLDMFDRDEPYARGCFLGRCVESSKDRLFGASAESGACNCTGRCGYLGSCNVDPACDESGHASCSMRKVHWWDGPLCMPVVRSHLSQADVTLHAFERDPIGDESYGETVAFIPLVRCPALSAGRGFGCPLELDLVPPGEPGGEARLTVTLSVRDLPTAPLVRRVQGRTMDTPCAGTRWGVQFGASGRFTGLRMPVYFRFHGLRSGRMIVDPVESPDVKPVSLYLGCEEEPQNTTTTTSTVFLLAQNGRMWSAAESMTTAMPALNNIVETNFAHARQLGLAQAGALCAIAVFTAASSA